MSDWGQKERHDERKDEIPPYSRIFVVCSKALQVEDLRPAFAKMGTIENIHMPRDRNTGESKGVAYIKYEKTSSAAAAIKEYHMQTIDKAAKPLKVMIACTRNDGSNESINEEKYKRLFILVPKCATEAEVREHFNRFGKVQSVYFLKGKSDSDKTCGFVTFESFLETAIALEECDKKYKPVFATPKDELKRNRNSFEPYMNMPMPKGPYMRDQTNEPYFPPRDRGYPRENIHFPPGRPEGSNKISVIVTPPLPQKFIERLFNIIPGMESFQFTDDSYNGTSKATVTYTNPRFAAEAMERINNFEFPSGEVVYVKPDNPLDKAASDLKNIMENFKHAVDGGSSNDLLQLADAIAQASSLIKAAATGASDARPEFHDTGFCSVKLPPLQPLTAYGTVAKRCFIVCKPIPPPRHILQDIFCRFGNLVDVTIFPNKVFGFARYASEASAQEAMRVLNEATVCGSTLKVVEADERQTSDNGTDDPKRMRIDTESTW